MIMPPKIYRRFPASRLSILPSDTELVISPRWLPTEILEQIVDLAMANSRMDLNPTSAPLNLRNANRWLRAIADGMQSLWSTMTITPEQFHESNVPVAKQWLTRAGATNRLQITLIANGMHGGHIQRILDTILPTTGQWESLHLHMPAMWTAYVLNNPAVSFPVLKRLKLVVDRHVVLSPDAPHLQEVRLHICPPIWQHTTIMSLGWESITFLDIDITSSRLDYVWHILFLSPQLDTLRVSASAKYMRPQYPVILQHRISSNIRELRLMFDHHPSLIAHFLYSLHLPRLESLELICFDQSAEPLVWLFATIVDLRQRCLPPLVRLIMAGKFVSQDDLIFVVRNLKYLEQLVAVDDGFDLVTDAVRELLPPDDASLQRQRAAYIQERKMAR